MEIYFMCCASMFLTILSMMRILYHTSSGQCLASAIKECAHTLDRIKMANIKDEKLTNIKLLKKDLKHYCISPINPLSAFSLSNSTLIGTFATILTYLIVLIQFKATEDEEKTKQLTRMEYMLQQLLRNDSNITDV